MSEGRRGPTERGPKTRTALDGRASPASGAARRSTHAPVEEPDALAEVLQQVRASSYLDVLQLAPYPAPDEVAAAANKVRQLVAAARDARRARSHELDEVLAAVDDAEAVLSDPARAQAYVRRNAE